MEVRRGVVNGVRRTVTGGGGGVAQVLTFNIDRQPVELTMLDPPQIEDGDDVAVAGDVVRGTLVARAFKNWSNGTYGKWATSMMSGCMTAVFGLMFIGFGLGGIGVSVSQGSSGGGIVRGVLLLTWGWVLLVDDQRPSGRFPDEHSLAPGQRVKIGRSLAAPGTVSSRGAAT